MADGDPAPRLAVEVVHFADLTVPRGYFYRAPGGPLARLRAGLRAGPDALIAPCLALLIRHPAGPILIDSGLHPAARLNLGADLGFPMRLIFRGMRPVGPSFDHQLERLGLDPGEIGRVVMTHLHADHTSALRLMPNAEVVCSAREWRAAQAWDAALKGYVANHLPARERVRLVDLTRDGVRHGALSRTIDLLGDQSIRLVSTPGHTPGHLSVLVAGEGGRDLLLAGDAVYTRENLADDLLPLVTGGDDDSRASMAELREFLVSSPRAVIIPSHDPEAWREIDPA